MATLAVVTEHPALAPLSARIHALQDEARRLAREHVAALGAALKAAEALSAEVARGGEAYPPGVRDIARRLAEEIAAKAQTLDLLSGRGL